jgi:hypothetical protein
METSSAALLAAANNAKTRATIVASVGRGDRFAGPPVHHFGKYRQRQTLFHSASEYES